MKKILLLSLLFFAPIAQPFSGQKTVAYTALAGGVGGLICCGYNTAQLTILIIHLDAQLQSKKLTCTQRAFLTALRYIYAETLTEYTLLLLSSATITMIGYQLLPHHTPQSPSI